MTKLILILCLLLSSCMSIYDRQPDDLSNIEPASTIDYKLFIIVNYDRLSDNEFKVYVRKYALGMHTPGIYWFKIRYFEMKAMGGELYIRLAVIYGKEKQKKNNILWEERLK